MGEVSPSICEDMISQIELALGNDDFEVEYEEFNWRKSANRRKFDRELFEKYGYMKEIILHPKFQYAKHFLEEHADLNVFLGDPLLPTTTIIIILFLINKRVSNNMVALAALMLFNVNPLYVCMAAATFWLLSGGKKPPKEYRNLKNEVQVRRIAGAVLSAPQPFTQEFATVEHHSQSEYDHVLIGSDISTLYTAALLARNGHRCCVLQPHALGSVLEVYSVSNIQTYCIFDNSNEHIHV